MTKVLITNCHLTHTLGETNKGTAAIMHTTVDILRKTLTDAEFTTSAQLSESFIDQLKVKMIKNKLFQIYKNELEKACQCGLDRVIEKYSSGPSTITLAYANNKQRDFKKLPPKVILDEEIEGIDVMEIERAVTCLLDNYIYATSGMGCVGPVIMLNKKDKEKAIEILQRENIL